MRSNPASTNHPTFNASSFYFEHCKRIYECAMLSTTVFGTMREFQQYEIWSLQHGKWELVAAFLDLQAAVSVARGRGKNVKLVLSKYEDGVQIAQEAVLNLGEVRQQ